jgi:DinB superfamily
MTDWVDALEPGAPDVIAAWRGIDAGRFISVRREVRRRAGEGTADRIAAQLATLADGLASIVTSLPESAFELPGGEGDWTVAEAIGHDVHARSGLVLAASLAASGRWPAAAPTVVPGVPGPVDVSRQELLGKIAQSQRLIDRATRAIAGHETDPCPLHHPLVGRLRCGEWILFAGVHDVMHLEQVHRLAGELVA